MGRLKICKTCQQETNTLWPNDGPAKRISGKGAAANIEVPPNKKIQLMVRSPEAYKENKENKEKRTANKTRNETAGRTSRRVDSHRPTQR
jgi:hypothetical protein